MDAVVIELLTPMAFLLERETTCMHVVVAATPIAGHVRPMMQVAEHLVDHGHDVTLVTAPEFAGLAASRGVPLRAVAEPTVTDDHGWRARRRLMPPGTDQLNLDLIELYARHVPAQHAALQEVCTSDTVLLCDAGYTGAYPMLLGADGVRVARAIGVGVTPMALRSDDTTPLSGPVGGDLEVARRAHRAANRQFVMAMRPAQDAIDRAVTECGARRPLGFFFDAGYTIWDAAVQLCVPELEYPRSDLPAGIHFVGPLAPPTFDVVDVPLWWPELASGSEVVVVTQGTLSNVDPTQLISPTIEALRGSDALVVVALGRDPAGLIATVDPPAENVRVGGFLPFSALLPHTGVLVTNGGYGGTQQALRHGIPVVVAGGGEDKPFVAARVAASGAGIDLKTGTPTPEHVRTAVDQVRTDPRYRRRAREIAASMTRTDALRSIEFLVRNGDLP